MIFSTQQSLSICYLTSVVHPLVVSFYFSPYHFGGQSCIAACGARGGVCNASATAPLSAAGIDVVVTELGGTCSRAIAAANSLSPFYDTRQTAPTPEPICYYSTLTSADCASSSSHPDWLRLCFCGDPSLVPTTTTTSSTSSSTSSTTTSSTLFHGWTMGAQGTVITENCNFNWIF